MSGLALILSLIALLSSSMNWNYTQYLSELPLQKWCSNGAPEISAYKEYYSAIVCGVNPRKGSELVVLMKHTGLLHLLVVSGSHLATVFSVVAVSWRWFPNPPDPTSSKQTAFKLLGGIFRIGLPAFALVGFSVMTGFQPPVVRALLAITLSFVTKGVGVHLRRDQQIQAAGFLTLILEPGWVSSISLLMSWTASLALVAGSPRSKSWLATCGWVYLLMIPFAIFGVSSHPLSLLANFIFAPVLGFLLFPLSALCMVVPWLLPLGDFCWEALTLILKHLAVENVWIQPSSGASPFWLWIYIIILHGAIHHHEVRRRQIE